MLNELINGRTPEEVRKGISSCFSSSGGCRGCPYLNEGYDCDWVLKRDAHVLIERMEAERDAAYRDIPHDCGTCKYWQDPPKTSEGRDGGLTVVYCDQDCSDGFPNWVWRGVKHKECELE